MTSLTMRYSSQQELEEKVCLICAPSLSKAFYDQLGYTVTILDIDKRFEELPGFIYFDLQKPEECQDPRVLKNNQRYSKTVTKGHQEEFDGWIERFMIFFLVHFNQIIPGNFTIHFLL